MNMQILMEWIAHNTHSLAAQWPDALIMTLVMVLGTWTTFSDWGFPRKERIWCAIRQAVLFLCLWGVCGVWIALPLTVLLCAFSLPTGWLRSMDGMGLWMLAAGTFYTGIHPDLTDILAQLIMAGSFFLIRLVFCPKYLARHGQVFFLCLIGQGIAMAVRMGFTLLVWTVLASGLAGFVLVTFVHRNHKPLLLFDLDGTLIDSRPLVFETFRRVFRQKKPDYPLSEKELYSFFGPTLETSFSRYFSEDEVPEVIDLYQQINLDLHKEYLKEMPYALETVQDLKSQGYQLGIVSNKRRKPVHLGMELSGLQPYFDLVYGKEDLPKPKPQPDGLVRAAMEMKIPLERVVYVGDNPSDIQAARKAGMFSVGYTLDKTQQNALKNAKACLQIDDLRQLEQVFEEDRIWIDKSIW